MYSRITGTLYLPVCFLRSWCAYCCRYEYILSRRSGGKVRTMEKNNKEEAEISEEVRRGMNQLKNATHYRRYRDGQCAAGGKEVRFCRGECTRCSYYLPPECIDFLVGRDAARNVYVHAISVEDMVLSKLALEEIVRLMEDVVPGAANTIAEMLLHEKNGAEIAKTLGWPESTYRFRMKKIQEHLRREMDL